MGNSTTHFLVKYNQFFSVFVPWTSNSVSNKNIGKPKQRVRYQVIGNDEMAHIEVYCLGI